MSGRGGDEASCKWEGLVEGGVSLIRDEWGWEWGNRGVHRLR